MRHAPGHDQSDADVVTRVAGMLNVDDETLSRARRLLGMLGDPGRRTVLERLSFKPQRAGVTLPDITGMNHPDIYHRLRSLLRGQFVSRNRHHVYSVDPEALSCASRYIDTLMVVAAYSARGGRS